MVYAAPSGPAVSWNFNYGFTAYACYLKSGGLPAICLRQGKCLLQPHNTNLLA